MIDILSVDGHEFTYFCPECSKRFGAPVKTMVNFHKGTNGRWDKFQEKHARCGVAELDERIDGHFTKLFPEWGEMEERIAWVQEFEGITKAEASVRYVIYWKDRWERRPSHKEPPPPTNMDPNDIPEEFLHASQKSAVE